MRDCSSGVIAILQLIYKLKFHTTNAGMWKAVCYNHLYFDV